MGGGDAVDDLSWEDMMNMTSNQVAMVEHMQALALEIDLTAQNARQLIPFPPQFATPSNPSNPSIYPGAPVAHIRQPHVVFTDQQLMVLKAQILAFRRLKKGDGNLPFELLQNIAPPALDSQM